MNNIIITPFTFGFPSVMTDYKQDQINRQNQYIKDLNKKITLVNNSIYYNTNRNSIFVKETIELLRNASPEIEAEVTKIRKTWSETLVRIACCKDNFLEIIYICNQIFRINDEKINDELRLQLSKCILKDHAEDLDEAVKNEKINRGTSLLISALDLQKTNFFTSDVQTSENFSKLYYSVLALLNLINDKPKIKNDIVIMLLKWVQNSKIPTPLRFFYCHALLDYSPTENVARQVIKKIIAMTRLIFTMDENKFYYQFPLSLKSSYFQNKSYLIALKKRCILTLSTRASEWSKEFGLEEEFKTLIEDLEKTENVIFKKNYS